MEQFERYCRLLPEHLVLRSPILMASLSLLCSLRCQIEQSEHWFLALQKSAEKPDSTMEQRQVATAALWSLRFMLPHRPPLDYLNIFPELALEYHQSPLALLPYDPSLGEPGVLDGYKDLSDLSLDQFEGFARTLPHLLSIPNSSLSCGLEIGAAEYAFYRGDSAGGSEAMLLSASALQRAISKECLNTYFAGTCVLARVMTERGKARLAMDYLQAFAKQSGEKNPTILKNSYPAFLAYLALYTGERQIIDAWMASQAPDEKAPLYLPHSFAYLVKVRCCLLLGQNEQAASLAYTLNNLFAPYHRVIRGIQAKALLAIALYRLNDPGYQTYLDQALDLSRTYGFVQPLAMEGVALRPLLQSVKKAQQDAFFVSLLQAVNQQAIHYPQYLSPAQGSGEPLREVERQILLLVGKGQTNRQIGDFLSLSPNTIKTYLKNIYAKLGVNSRVAATCKAASMGLL